MKINVSNKRFITKILSVIAGIIFWVIIVYIEDASFDTTLKGIPVQLSGEIAIIQSDLVVVNKGEIGSASIAVRGKRSDIINSMDNISAVADISKITSPGVYNIKVSYDLATNALYITERKTQSVEIVVEKAVEKEVDIAIVQQGTNPNSNIIIETKTGSDKVRVKAAARDIEKISSMAAFVDISGMTEDNISKYPIKAVDEQMREIKLDYIYSEYDGIEVESKFYQKIKLPIEVEFNQRDMRKYAFQIESISAKEAEVGVLDNIEVESLKLPVDYDEKTGEIKYTVPIEPVRGVYIPPEYENITVKLKVQPVVEKTVAIPLTVTSKEKADGEIPKEISVRLKGAETELLAENVKATLDLSGYHTGNHNIKVLIEPLKDNISITEEKYIDVQIK